MLGTYMLRTLAALNDSEHYDMKLYGLVRHPEKMPEDLKKRVSLITQSVSREIETDVRFDYIIHAASPASPLIMREDPAGTIAANTLGTIILWNWHERVTPKDIFSSHQERSMDSHMKGRGSLRKTPTDLSIRWNLAPAIRRVKKRRKPCVRVSGSSMA